MRGKRLILIFCLVLISLSMVSASLWGSIFGSSTGKVIDTKKAVSIDEGGLEFQPFEASKSLESCYDSDNGAIYGVFGYVSGNLTNDSFYFSDYCSDSNILVEYICSEGFPKGISYDCSGEGKVCEGGACVVANDTFEYAPFYLIYDSQGSTLDTILLSNIQNWLYNREVPSTITLNGNVTMDDLDYTTSVFTYNQDSLIIVPSGNVSYLYAIQVSALNNYLRDYVDSHSGFRICDDLITSDSLTSDNLLDALNLCTSWHSSNDTNQTQECSTDDDCVNTQTNFCNDLGQACTSSTIYSCLNNECVVTGGGGGCTPVCPNGCLAGACLESVDLCEEEYLDIPSEPLYIGNPINNVKYILTDSELPELLSDDFFAGNVVADYVQTIKIGSRNIIPGPFIDLGSGMLYEDFYKYGLTFDQAVDFTSPNSLGEHLNLLGRDFAVGAGTNANNLYLYEEGHPLDMSIGASDPSSIGISINGENYVIVLISGTDVDATIKVTDSSGLSETKEVSEGHSKVIQGLEVGVLNVEENSNQQVIVATLTVGKEKFKLTPGSFIRKGYNEDPIDGTYVFLEPGEDWSSATGFEVFILAPNSEYDLGIGETWTDPFVNNLKVVFELYNNQTGAKIKFGGCVDGQTTNQTCTDSDGGLNYYEVGYAQDSDGSLINDGCIQESGGLLLTATGVVSVIPQGNQTGSCILSAPFTCSGVSASSEQDSINFDIVNGAQQDIPIESISLSGCNSNDTSQGLPGLLRAGEEKTYTIHCSVDLVAGETFDSDLMVTYRMGESHDGWLREAICGEDNQATWTDYNCPNGCSNQVCIAGNVSCGDVNDDGVVNVLDILYFINYKFKNGAAPVSMWAANVNGDGSVDLLDILYLIDYKFKEGDDLNCEEPTQISGVSSVDAKWSLDQISGYLNDAQYDPKKQQVTRGVVPRFVKFVSSLF